MNVWVGSVGACCQENGFQIALISIRILGIECNRQFLAPRSAWVDDVSVPIGAILFKLFSTLSKHRENFVNFDSTAREPTCGIYGM
jgi:hypothetical protein